MSCAVVVPFRGGCPYRERAWGWVQAKYKANHPDWDLVVTEPAPGPWVKAAVVNSAVRCSTVDLIVVADADVWHPGLVQAVDAVRRGGNPWAIPHRGVFRLTEESTERLFAGQDFEGLPLTQPAYLGYEGGGFVVARRETLLDVPMPRFVGWGQEDEAFGMALRTLAGPPWRGKGPLIHCWHPPAPRVTRKWGSLENRAQVRRFHAANGNPQRMRALLDEVNAEPAETISGPGAAQTAPVPADT